jgi:outer membrane protein TolC
MTLISRYCNQTTATFFIILIFSFPAKVQAQEKKVFTSLEEVWQEIKKQNITFRNAEIQSEIAELTYKTSLGNLLNPRMPLSVTMVDNTKLQQNLIPAEAFGGPAGTFREITLGQQYNTLLSFQPQFDIVNMASVAQINAAKINIELTRSQNELNESALYQSVNVTYHNIVSLQNQKLVLTENLKVAEQILSIVKNRFEEGMIRKQEVNEAEVNVISVRDKIEQIELNIELQKYILALFFENSIIPEISEDIAKDAFDIIQTPEINKLAYRNLVLQSGFLRQDIRSLKYQYYPVLSFTSSFNWQSLSNDNFFTDNSTNIRYNFVGLKLTWDFPVVQKVSNIKNKQYQLLTLQNQQVKVKNEADLQCKQLSMELEKAQKQLSNFKTISLLKKDTYDKNMDQYQENILSFDRLLISYNDLIIAQLNEVNAQSSMAFVKNKILIHNLYK